jgi:hypothetical protein
MTILDMGTRFEVATKVLPTYIETQIVKQEETPLPSDLPISRFASKQAIVEYKAMALRAESAQSSVMIQTKGVRAVFDPKLGPQGGWRCPTGTRYGGYITNRFGRGCGGGVARRLGRSLERLGRNIGQNAEAGEKRRLARRAAKQKYRAERAAIRQRYPRAAGRAANRLADRIEKGPKKKRPAKPNKRVIKPAASPKPPKRSKRGSTPKQKPIAKRGNRVGRAFDRLADRIERGPKRKRKPSPRKQRVNASQQRQPKPAGQRPKKPVPAPSAVTPKPKTPAPRPVPAPAGRRPKRPWGEGSMPDDRSERNVRNRFPRGGLPKKAYWRDAAMWGDREEELERRFGRYYDKDNNLNARGRFVNERLKKKAPAKKAPAKKAPAKKAPAKKAPAKKAPAKKAPAKKAPAKKAPKPIRPSSSGPKEWGSGPRPDTQEISEAKSFFKDIIEIARKNLDAEGVAYVEDLMEGDPQDLPAVYAWWRDNHVGQGPAWDRFVKELDDKYGKWYVPGRWNDRQNTWGEFNQAGLNKRGKYIRDMLRQNKAPAKKAPAKKAPAKKAPAKKAPPSSPSTQKDSPFSPNARKDKKFGVLSRLLGFGTFSRGKNNRDGANGIDSQAKANEFVKNGGAIDKVPNKYLGLAIETNSSDRLDDPNTRFFQKVPDEGAIGYTRLYFERSTFDPSKGFPTNSPNAQGYVVKGTEFGGSDDHVREAMGWNMAVGHGVNQEGAIMDGMVRGVTVFGGMGLMPATVLPLAMNQFEPGEVVTGAVPADFTVFNNIPNRAFPERLRHMLHNHLLGVGDRNRGNMYYSVVNGKPTISVLDQSRAGDVPTTDFAAYQNTMYDQVLINFRRYVRNVPVAEQEKYRQEMREVYEDMVNRSGEFLRNVTSSQQFIDLHMEGVDAATLPAGAEARLRDRLTEVYFDYVRKHNFMKSPAGMQLLEAQMQ